MSQKLSTQPYKGTRDFYPAEMRGRQWIFQSISSVAESFGFEKIDAPMVEPLDVYLAKTSEEIVSQQLYSFEDRGGRKVAMRPEMTPTVSRMVAQKFRELPRPIRWYCLPNLWRYERPGKGRLREHWQLNCDIFAAENELAADVEILQLAIETLKVFGANENNFQVHINHRRILNSVFANLLELSEAKNAEIARIMDKKAKVSPEDYSKMLGEAGLDQNKQSILNEYIDGGLDFLQANAAKLDSEAVNALNQILSILNQTSYEKYVKYDPRIIRGFDYYTSLIFEIYDCHPENRRSLFGGGRYDNLVGYFSKETANAIGFGMGDVTLVEFLETHGLMKQFSKDLDLYIVNVAGEKGFLHCNQIAAQVRAAGFNVETSLSSQKIAKQMQAANNKEARFACIIGEDEIESEKLTLKNMVSGEQKNVELAEAIKLLQG